MIQRLLILLFVMVSISDVVSQQRKANFYKTEIINTDQGLSNSVATDLLQDHDGLIWIGTEYGLNLYDGQNIKVFVHSETENSINGNSINSLYEDKAQRIWIATAGQGLCYFDQNKKVFVDFQDMIPKKDSANLALYTEGSIKTFAIDSSENLWIGSYNGLLRYNLQTHNYKIYNKTDKDNLISGNTINAIFIGSNNRIFIGTEYGLDIYDQNTEKFSTILLSPDNADKNHILCLKNDPYGILWIGTRGGGLFKYDLELNTVEQADFVLDNEKIWSLEVDRDNRLWISAHYILFIYDLDDKELINTVNLNIDAISSTRIYSKIQATKDGYVIATTNGEGFRIFDPYGAYFRILGDKPTEENGLRNSMVRSIKILKGGKALIGTQGGWLHEYDPSSTDFKVIEGVRNAGYFGDILCSYQAENGDIYVGTYLYGMIILKAKTKEFELFQPNSKEKYGIYDSDIRMIKKRDNHTLWIGTNEKGLYTFDMDDHSFRFVDKWEGVGAIDVEVDKKGNVWVPSYYGLKVFKNDDLSTAHIFRYNKKDSTSLSHDQILDIKITRNGSLWIATMGGGLNRFNYSDSTFTRFTEKDGLASNYINSIVEDNEGILWMGTSHGLSSYNPRSNSFRNYYVQDGLPSNIFNIKSAGRLPNGEILMGTPVGFIQFDPKSLKKKNFPTSLHFMGLKINGKEVGIGSEKSPLTKSINELESIKLNYKQNSFSISYTSLTLSNIAETQFLYKLSPLQSDWIETGNTKEVVFNNIPAGTYTFHLAVRQNGVLNTENKFLQIIILDPWWQTWWFKVFILITLITGSYAGYRVTTHKMVKKNRDLQDTNKELDQFAYIISHDLKAPLRAITNLTEWIEEDLGENINEDVKNNFSLMKSRVKRMESLINGVLSYSRVSKKTLVPDEVNTNELLEEVIDTLDIPENFDMKISVKLPIVIFPKVLLEQVFSNLISNAVKYHDKPKGTITVDYRKDGNFHEFSVTDDGPGIDPEYHEKVFAIFQTLQPKDTYESTGVGLTIVKKIIEDWGGTIHLESEKGKGAKFTFTISRSLSKKTKINQ